MEITFKNITYEKDNIYKIESIYKEAFPEIERFDFEFLLRASKRKDNFFLVVYDSSDLIGMTYLICSNDILYVLYLCVDSNKRGQGYGSEILNLLKKEFSNYNIILDIEELKKESKNYKQRVRRKSFYEKNGFTSTGIAMENGGESYEYMTTNSNIKITNKLIAVLFSKLYNPVHSLFARFRRFNLYSV